MALPKLNGEIEIAALTVATDDFQMTIGELVNLYRDGDLIINPNFQRFFRWDIGRKSSLIESILLGIPIPPIFIFERHDSKWELIDGLQRISTILEFMGLLLNPETRERMEPIFLTGTQYLPSLSGAVWEDSFLRIETEHSLFAFDGSLQRSIKRSKLGLQILEKKSDDKSKFDLFQRLNSGGITANPQELRNCVIIMSNEKFFEEVKGLTQDNNFKTLVPLGSESVKKANDFEHVCRIIAFGFKDYVPGVDIEEFVNRAVIEISLELSQDQHKIMREKIEDTFALIRRSLGDNGLRPYEGGNFHGRVGRTSIEVVFLGILHNYEKISALGDPPDYLLSRTQEFWQTEESKTFAAAGVSGTDRVAKTIPFGRTWYNPDELPPS